MKANRIAGMYILAVLFCFQVFQIIYLSCNILPFAAEEPVKRLGCLFLVQSIFFAACILMFFLAFVLRLRKKRHTSPFDSFVLISGKGKIAGELLLHDKHSFVVTGKKSGKEVCFGRGGDVAPDRYLYGICNLSCGCWYFEAAPGRPVGLRRGNEGMVYRLKAGIPYRLFETDVIYVDTFKIAVRQQK